MITKLTEQKWLVPGKFAVAFIHTGGHEMVEIFETIPDKRHASGYTSKFLFAYNTLEEAAKWLPAYLAETRDMANEKWSQLILHLCGAKKEKIMASEGLIPEAP